MQRGRYVQPSNMGLVMLRADMTRTMGRRAAALAACALAACAIIWSGEAKAQSVEPGALSRVLEQIQLQEQRLDAQQALLSQQQRQLSEQRSLIERQRQEILALSGGVSDAELGEIRGAGAIDHGLAYVDLPRDMPIPRVRRAPLQRASDDGSPAMGGGAPSATAAAQTVAPAVTPPARPVGEAPPEQEQTTVEALPEGQNALLGRGRLVIEPSLEYSRSSSNRLVFRGVEIVTGIQIGLLEANDTARDTISGSLAVRYAVTDKLEIEGRVPYLYRSDRVTTVAQNNNTVTQTFELEGSDLGDVELSARYQITNGARGGPIFVAGARIKSDTGRGPFDVARDSQGVASELATGSGFWGLQGSLSVLYPSDPVVLFANVGYLYNMPRDINRQIGTVTIGEVDPGDSISLGFGFGFAVNQRFSYSLGYSHAYVMETETELNNTLQQSTALQVGSVQMGMSFRATERLTLSTSVDFGVTTDAPDVRVSFRAPLRW